MQPSGPDRFSQRVLIAGSAWNVSPPRVPVGLKPPFCGKALAPTTKTFGTSQLCRYLLTALVEGSAPITAPPVLCVLWYGTMLYFPRRGLALIFPAPAALATSAAFFVRYSDILCSLSWKSKVMRSSG